MRAWLLEQDWAEWDRQIEQDGAAGKLDGLMEQALADHATGKSRLHGTWTRAAIAARAIMRLVGSTPVSAEPSAADAMPEYRLSSDFEKGVRRRLAMWALPFSLMAAGAGLWIGARQSGSGAGTWPALLWLLPALAIGLFRSYRQQVRQGRSLRLSVTQNQICREADGLPRVILNREDVKRIELHKSGDITIRGAQLTQTMRIPRSIQDRDELLHELQGWAPIAAASPNEPYIVGGTVAVSVAGALVAVSVLENRLVVGILGSLLFVALMTCSVILWQSRHLDPRNRGLAFVALLPALAMLVRVILVITGG